MKGGAGTRVSFDRPFIFLFFGLPQQDGPHWRPTFTSESMTIVKQLGSVPRRPPAPPSGLRADFLGIVEPRHHGGRCLEGRGPRGASFDRIPLAEAVGAFRSSSTQAPRRQGPASYRETLVELARRAGRGCPHGLPRGARSPDVPTLKAFASATGNPQVRLRPPVLTGTRLQEQGWVQPLLDGQSCRLHALPPRG